MLCGREPMEFLPLDLQGHTRVAEERRQPSTGREYEFVRGIALVGRLDDDALWRGRPALDLHARFGAELPTMHSLMHLYPIYGAAHDVGSSDTAWNYREANWATVYGGVDPDPANVDAIRDWSIGFFEALHPYSAGGAYVNMMMDEGTEHVRSSYRDNYDRLAQIKARYDPANTFRINQNIVPADPGS